MKNRERYEKEILEIACDGSYVAVVNGKPVPCRGTNCKDCDLHCKNHRTISRPCAVWRKEWSESEYIEIDWCNVDIDTPILVRDSVEERWVRRHFAGYDGTSVGAWVEGRTSWSTNGCAPEVKEWRFAKLEETEQGKLTRLPCQVDDKIYAIVHDYEKDTEAIEESRIIRVTQNVNGWFFESLINIPAFRLHDFGKIVFLTREAAEAKLKEMEGSHE